MIGIGINENIYLEKAEQPDNKESLILTFKQKGEKELSLLEQLNAEEHIEAQNDLAIRLFCPLPSTKPDMTEAKIAELALLDLNSVKGQLTHILEGYMVTADANLGGGLYDGTGIDPKGIDYMSKFGNRDILKIIFNNLVEGFLKRVKPFLNNPEYLFRLLLLRQSKNKHFPTLRKRYLKESPIWEPMVIPVEGSKVKFSDYEKREGLDSNAVIDKKDADPKDTAPTQSAEQIFKGVNF